MTRPSRPKPAARPRFALPPFLFLAATTVFMPACFGSCDFDLQLDLTPCTSDEECPEEQVCYWGLLYTTCAEADVCDSNADCDPGFECKVRDWALTPARTTCVATATTTSSSSGGGMLSTSSSTGTTGGNGAGGAGGAGGNGNGGAGGGGAGGAGGG